MWSLSFQCPKSGICVHCISGNFRLLWSNSRYEEKEFHAYFRLFTNELQTLEQETAWTAWVMNSNFSKLTAFIDQLTGFKLTWVLGSEIVANIKAKTKTSTPCGSPGPGVRTTSLDNGMVLVGRGWWAMVWKRGLITTLALPTVFMETTPRPNAPGLWILPKTLFWSVCSGVCVHTCFCTF